MNTVNSQQQAAGPVCRQTLSCEWSRSGSLEGWRWPLCEHCWRTRNGCVLIAVLSSQGLTSSTCTLTFQEKRSEGDDGKLKIFKDSGTFGAQRHTSI